MSSSIDTHEQGPGQRAICQAGCGMNNEPDDVSPADEVASAARRMHPRPSMKRIVALVVLVGALSSGCMVGRHGHISMVAPPLLLAAAVAATARPGYVWVEGHWDWNDDHWIWTEGYWVAEQPGFVWVQGLWLNVDGGYSWRPGHWRASGPRFHVHDRQ